MLKTLVMLVLCSAALESQVVTKPTRIANVLPQYSEEARRAGVNAVILVSLVVDSQGLPQNIQITRDAGFGLEAMARQAVGAWRFNPAMSEGKAVDFNATVQVNFRTEKSQKRKGPSVRLLFRLDPGLDERPILEMGRIPDAKGTPRKMDIIEFEVDASGGVQNVSSSTNAPKKSLEQIRDWQFSANPARPTAVARLELTYREAGK